jgi:hypothetical protein
LSILFLVCAEIRNWNQNQNSQDENKTCKQTRPNNMISTLALSFGFGFWFVLPKMEMSPIYALSGLNYFSHSLEYWLLPPQ